MPNTRKTFMCACGCGPLKSREVERQHLAGIGPSRVRFDHFRREEEEGDVEPEPVRLKSQRYNPIARSGKTRTAPSTPIEVGDPGPSTLRHRTREGSPGQGGDYDGLYF